MYLKATVSNVKALILGLGSINISCKIQNGTLGLSERYCPGLYRRRMGGILHLKSTVACQMSTSIFCGWLYEYLL
jgi:hypothetical protein